MLTRNRRLLLFSALYFAQGTILSYFLTFNILYLGENGYSPEEVGIGVIIQLSGELVDIDDELA